MYLPTSGATHGNHPLQYSSDKRRFCWIVLFLLLQRLWRCKSMAMVAMAKSMAYTMALVLYSDMYSDSYSGWHIMCHSELLSLTYQRRLILMLVTTVAHARTPLYRKLGPAGNLIISLHRDEDCLFSGHLHPNGVDHSHAAHCELCAAFLRCG